LLVLDCEREYSLRKLGVEDLSGSKVLTKQQACVIY
jgi:hypothetical protein